MNDVYHSEDFAKTAEMYSIFNISQRKVLLILPYEVSRRFSYLPRCSSRLDLGAFNELWYWDIAADYTIAVHLDARDFR